MKLTKVLQIGINYFNTQYELRGCIPDVERLNSFMKTEFDCSQTQFRVMTDKKTTPTELQPNRNNIYAAFDWITSGIDSNSVLFLTYSGHGTQERDLNGDEVDGKDECICALDGNIIDDEIRSRVVEKLPKGCKLFAIFDACFSGSVMDLKYSYSINIKSGVKEYNIIPSGKYKDNNSKVVCFSGCSDIQTSADARIDNGWSGALTYAFVKTIKEIKKKKKPLRYKDVMKQLLVFMKGNGYTQTPQISTCYWLNLDEVMW